MRYIRWLGTMAVLLCGAVFVRAGESSAKLKFQPAGVAASLPTNEVRNLFQDSEGYIWISTYNGLVRYDGYVTQVYRPGVAGDGKSVDGFVNIVQEDGERKLWVGTHNGLYFLDKRTDRMEQVTDSVLREAYTEAMVVTREGELWVGTNRGVFRKRRGSETFERCTADRYPGAGAWDVKFLTEDRKGHIWVGTWRDGLFRYDPEQQCFFGYEGLNPAHSAHSVYQDREGNVWIGTWGYGLLRLLRPYDREHYSFVRYRHDPRNPHSLGDDIIYRMGEDANTGKLWIGMRRGLSVLETEADGGTFTNYLPDPESGGLPYGEVDALLCSRDSLMWVGMLGGGLYVANTRKPLFPHDPLQLKKPLPATSVRSIFPADDGKLWMGMMGFGLMLYDPVRGEAVGSHELPAFAELPAISTVSEIIRLQCSGAYAFATWDDGVWVYDGSTVRVMDCRTCPTLTDDCIYSLLEDRKGNLWVGSRMGLFMQDGEGEWHTLEGLSTDTSITSLRPSIFKLAEDNDGAIWAATATAGIWKLMPKAGGGYALRTYTASQGNAMAEGALTLCVDGHNRVWEGTNGSGLNLYDRQADCFRPVLESEIGSEATIYCILTDEADRLWFTTASEMLCADVPLGKEAIPDVRTYTVTDGLQDSPFNRNACCKNGGILYFGGVYGFNYFRPSDIPRGSTAHPVVITDLRVANVPVRNMERAERDNILQGTSLYDIDRLVLTYRQNDFRIAFSLLNYLNPLSGRYEYRLEGYDHRWISVGGYQHFASYSNLPAGEYLFQVRGTNAHGVWSPVRTIKVTLLPPPWLSGKAYALYALLALLLAWMAFRIVRNRICLKRAIELGVMDRQHLEELNHAKLQFFTNITHELLTPLSIITAGVEELRKNVPPLPQTYQVISDNTVRLIRLIQQILEFRKVEHGQHRLRVSEGDIARFVRRSVAAFVPLMRKKKLTVRVEGDEEVRGWFDTDKLDKILYNLLSNAAKYTEAGGVVTVSTDYDAATGRFRLSVNNPGEPIPADRQAHLFDRFYEGEYRKFHTIGTGIGLSLTRDLVRLHHGTIRVESNPEQGNTFVVELPLHREAYAEAETDCGRREELEECIDTDESQPVGEGAPEAEPDVAAIDGTPTLLLVEDNDELRALTARLLGGKYHVLKAADGMEALDLLAHEETDIIVSDVMMPGMDGRELCRRVKETFETCHIPVILLTVKNSDVDRTEGYEAGADGYLCRPVSSSVLRAKIDNLLKRRRQVGVDFRKQLVFEAKELNYTSMDEAFIRKAMDCVNAHLSDCGFEHADFVAEMGVSRTTLADKLKQLTGLTPSGFISNVRLQAACRLMDEQKNIRITDLAYAVGFNDPKYFSACFRKKFGVSPKEFLGGKRG